METVFLKNPCSPNHPLENFFQPWDMFDSNVSGREGEVPSGALIIGGSNCLYDGVTMIETEDRRVEAYARRSLIRQLFVGRRKLFEWPSVDAWLFAEINRLTTLFDDRGRLIAPEELARFDLGARH